MAILTITVIALVGFSNHNAYAIDYTVSNQASCEALPPAFVADWVGDFGPYTNICRIQADVTLTSGDTLTADGVTLQVDAGTVTNAGTITINDGSTLYSIDTIHNTGNINVLSGGSFDIESSQTNNDAGGIITNDGTININAEAGIKNNLGGIITNLGDGSINNNQNINNYGTITNTGSITNTGTIDNNFGTGNNGIINNNPGGIIDNTGTITNTSGISNSDTITNTANGIIDNHGTIANYGTISNYGTSSGGGTITNSGNIENEPGANIYNTGTDGGSSFITNTGTIDNYGLVSNHFSGGTADITNNGIFTNFCGSTFTNIGGTTTGGSNPINTLCVVFDHATYPVGGTAIITVTSTADDTSEGIDHISGNVNSTSDITGIPFNATETGTGTGIFVSIPSITLTSGPSTGSSLHVASGDTINANFGGVKAIATITGVTPTISLSINNTSPKWGVDTVGASGTAAGFTGTDKIIIKWADGVHDVIPAAASWGPISHIYPQGTVGAHNVNATLVDSTLAVVKAGPSANIVVNVQKHKTALSTTAMNPASPPGVKWGKTFTANATLTDVDNSGARIAGEVLSFNGTGTSVGTVGSVSSAATGVRGFNPPTTMTASGLGTVGTQNVNAKFAGDANYLASSSNTPITILKHATALTVSPKSQFFAGNSFSAIGTLTDNDLAGIGVNGKTITFSGVGAFNLQPTLTNPITFTDASGMTTSAGFLNVHASTTIDTPSHPPAAVLTFKGVAAGTISVAVTFLGDNSPNPDIITQAVSAGDVSLNLVYANGMTQIQIISFPGPSPTIAIGSLQIQDSNLQTIQNIQFASIPSPGNVLTVGSGAYSSVGKLGPASNSNQLNANFAGDGNYIGSPATTTYSIYPQTAAGSGNAVTVLGDVNTGFLTQACTSGPAAGTDGDYICDNWKTTGIPIGTYSGTKYNYTLPGVHKGEKDLYVEIDYMATHTPNPNSITDVVNAFKNSGVANTFSPGNGINLHVTTDQQLTQVPALNVWKDNDYVNNNDFDSIKNANFGNATEHPVLAMVTEPTISPSPPTGAGPYTTTITVSGISVTTPTSKPTNGITNGKVVLSMNMTLGASATVTAGAVTKVLATESFPAAFKLGTPTQKVTTSATNANIRVITLTIPFNSTSAVGPINLGTITVAETLTTAPSVSIVRNYGSPTIFTDLLSAKAQAYHYFLWAHSLGRCGPSGQSEVQGNDGIVSLGCNFDTSAPEFNPLSKDANGNYQTVGTQREQAGTFLHELGHNLGLNHGGPVLVGGTTTADSPINCKPNYPSVMSYSRELPGYLGASWTPDFSHGTLNGLDETALKENTPTGLFNSGTAPTIVWNTLIKDASGNTFRTALASSPTLDWDGNGSPSATTVTGDVNNFGITGCTASYPETIASYPYKDYNDWTNLNFNMRAGLLGNFDGVLGPVIHEAAHSDTDANVAQQIAIQSLKFQPISPPTSFELHWLTGVPLPLTFQLYQSDGKTPIITATGHAEYTTDGTHFTRISPDFQFTKTSLGNFYLTTWKTTIKQFPKETHVGINFIIDVPTTPPTTKTLFDPAHKVVIQTHQVTLKIEFEK